MVGGKLSVRLLQVVKVLHQLFVVHTQVEVVQFDGVTTSSGVLVFLIRRCCGRRIEREHRVADDGGPFHVHRPPVASLHEKWIRVPFRGFGVVTVTVARHRRSSASTT